MINESLNVGEFPNTWKSAIITPLLKKENLEIEYKNFRPVNDLNFISKITEKTALDQLGQQLQSNNLNSNNNHAYKKHHSTETLLLKV